ncbi:MAG: DUF389 domain-containing protein [Ignavibacteriota bacterium]
MKKTMTLFQHFGLDNDRDDFSKTISSIVAGVVFKGTNLWILICAILIASVGLNVNSTAVIIGAMLISPLMGPLMGIGLGIGTNDLELVKNAMRNYGFALVVGLVTSCLYFLVSPIEEAHSELLARTSPAIWDVLIALFGGLAGIIATSSKNKANVIPGVAIATALMPPLCTAGFGLAHQQWNIFFGAIYLFIINSVFIGLATLFMVRFLRFPMREYADPKRQSRVRKLIFAIVIITIIPSIFAAYNIVQSNRFRQSAKDFIASESPIGDNYLLNKNIDESNKTITLVYGGKGLTDSQKNALHKKLGGYGISEAKLIVTEGFSMRFMDEKSTDEKKLIGAMDLKQQELDRSRQKLDSIGSFSNMQQQMLSEAHAEHPELRELTISPLVVTEHDSVTTTHYLVYYRFARGVSKKELKQLSNWTKVKLPGKELTIISDTK